MRKSYFIALVALAGLALRNAHDAAHHAYRGVTVARAINICWSRPMAEHELWVSGYYVSMGNTSGQQQSGALVDRAPLGQLHSNTLLPRDAMPVVGSERVLLDLPEGVRVLVHGKTDCKYMQEFDVDRVGIS